MGPPHKLCDWLPVQAVRGQGQAGGHCEVGRSRDEASGGHC